MKQILLTIAGFLAFTTTDAQVLFYEDFQDISDIEYVILLDELFEQPTMWALTDEDTEDDNNGDPSVWLWSVGPEHTAITGGVPLIELDGVEDTSPNGIVYPWMNTDGVEDTNLVFSSTSWLGNANAINTNYLVIPEVTLDGNAVLTWKSSTGQGPRYSDGYGVMISTDEYEQFESYEEIFRVAECIPPVPSSSTVGADALDLAQGMVFHGPDGAYIPYNGFDTTAYLGTYFHLGGELYENSTAFRGLLEPFSIDLSAYAGETVRILFVHDSHDDVDMMIDDIMIELPLGVQEEASEFFEIYPNPASDNLNLQFTDKMTGVGVIRIIDANGKLVQSAAFKSNGNSELRSFDVSNLATGNYNFQLIRDGKAALNTTFIKK